MNISLIKVEAAKIIGLPVSISQLFYPQQYDIHPRKDGCFINEKNEEITEIEFPLVNAGIRKSENGGLFIVRCPGSYLTTTDIETYANKYTIINDENYMPTMRA